MDDNERYRTGLAIRRTVLGDEHVDRALAGRDELTADFQELVTRYAWGELWARDGLDRRTRSMITLALLATLRHDEELGLHVQAARRLGVTTAEISEVLLHAGLYAGLPVANRALAVAQRALAQTPSGDDG